MRVVLVVGASGVGKDTLIKGAKNLLKDNKDVKFIRRYITRAPDENEDNIYKSHDEMKKLIESDKFVAWWEAHGNIYGIMHSDIDAKINIISISRGAIAKFEEALKDTVVINVVASKDVLKHRLLKRGRESLEDIEKRLNRADKKVFAKNLIEFKNDKDLDKSITEFTQIYIGEK